MKKELKYVGIVRQDDRGVAGNSLKEIYDELRECDDCYTLDDIEFFELGRRLKVEIQVNEVKE